MVMSEDNDFLEGSRRACGQSSAASDRLLVPPHSYENPLKVSGGWNISHRFTLLPSLCDLHALVVTTRRTKKSHGSHCHSCPWFSTS